MAIPIWSPDSAAAIAARLGEAARDRQTVAPRGGGTKLSWLERDAAIDAWISTLGLTTPILHDPGDMVATLPAGVTLAEANLVLAGAGQWLPLDPAHAERATIGGILATNDSGPRRQRFGAPRDLVLGVEAAMTDGTVAHAGGRVVKNVAGYDLSRLLCGSHGQLAIVTSATFKLAPIAAASRTVVAEFPDVGRAADASLELVASHLTPSALELAAPSPRLLVRFESSVAAATAMALDAQAMLAGAGGRAAILMDTAEQAVWARHEQTIWQEEATIVKLSLLPTHGGTILEQITSAGHGLEWAVAGRAGLGVFHLRLNGANARQAAVLRTLETETVRTGGRLTVLQANEHLRRDFNRQPDYGDAQTLMQAVKASFDPKGVLAGTPLLRSDNA